MHCESGVLGALKLIWIACLMVDALPEGRRDLADVRDLAEVRDNGASHSQQNVPELMMDLYNCDHDESCLLAYDWPAELPPLEYTVRAIVGNVSRNGNSLLASFLLSTTDHRLRSTVQLRFFKNMIPDDCASIFGKHVDGDELKYTLMLKSEETGLYECVDNITVSKEDLLEDRWITFSNDDLSEKFRQWIKHGKEVVTFKVEVGVKFPELISALSCPQSGKEPLVLEFLRINQDSQLSFLKQLEDLDFSRSKREEDGTQNNSSNPPPESGCHREDLIVPFKFFQMHNTIPSEYNAYYCSGVCKYPIPSHQTGFHAQVHAVLSEYKYGGRVPLPCCVPTNYTHIQVLKQNEYGVFEVDIFYYASVTECGCR